MLPSSLTNPDPTDPDDTSASEPRPASVLLPWAIKVCLVAGLFGFGATQYLSRVVDGSTSPTREARLGPADPETTGSIAGPASRTTLDPCTAAGLRTR